MTREELRTLAALDVFGLLDEYESNQYTRSFHHASAAVQDEIIDLQAAIAENPPLLSSEMPAESLRGDVLRAVTAAMETDARKFAPIGSIGRNRMRAEGDMARAASFRGTQYWRAAAFVLAGALIVVLYFFKTTVDRVETVTEFAIDKLTIDQARHVIGNDFEYFANNPDCDQVLLASTDAAHAASGILYLNRETQEAFLFTVGLDQSNTQYTLRCNMNDGSTTEIDSFSPRIALFGLRLDRMSTALLASVVRWEIATLDGTVILRSA